MVRVERVEIGRKVYPQTIDINGRTARKATKEEVKQKGLLWAEGIYFFEDDGSYVRTGLVEAIVNPETDPILIEREKRRQKEDYINPSL